MKVLSIDIETRSSTDLTKSGVYKYVEDTDFAILMAAYKFEGISGEWVSDFTKPDDLTEFKATILPALIDPGVLKTAFNANFERTCLAKFFGVEMPPEQWECTMVKSAMCGLPLSLDNVSKALNLGEAKDATGKSLIRYFSVPCKPTKANGFRTWNLPEHALDKWKQFLDYCLQDVKVETSIRERLSYFGYSDRERALWVLDQQINDRGVLLDLDLARGAISIDTEFRHQLIAEAIEITGLENPNSVKQLTEWLSEETDEEIKKLRKEDVVNLLSTVESEKAKRVLAIRQMMSKTSLKKYPSMLKMACADNCFRGILQIYGANRTGRFAGRGIQLHNLPKNTDTIFGKGMKHITMARELTKRADGAGLKAFFTEVQNTLSQLLRPAFIPRPGYKFIPADFSAIEARVIAWLAGEKWRLDVFNGDGWIYEASAAAILNIPVSQIAYKDEHGNKVKGPRYDVRGKIGKVAELACGFQGGVGALIRMGAYDYGLKDEELQPIVDAWRLRSPNIVKLWYDCQKAAIQAVKTGQKTRVRDGLLQFKVLHDTLWMKLPSGRSLAYYKPRITQGKYGDQLSYMGVDQEKKTWGHETTYGGKIVENAVQAIARDCLVEAMLRVNAAGYQIAFHVHDEIVLEVPENSNCLDDINRIMSMPVDWAPGLPLIADSYESRFYMKED